MKPSDTASAFKTLLTFLLGFVGLMLLQTSGSAQAASSEDESKLHEEVLYKIRLPQGWEKISARQLPDGQEMDQYKKGSTHFTIRWVPSSVTTNDALLIMESMKPYKSLMDLFPPATSTGMGVEWHGRPIFYGNRVSGKLRSIPVVVSVAVIRSKGGQFVLIHATNNEDIPEEEKTLVSSFTPKN